jgi:hypothetical protein
LRGGKKTKKPPPPHLIAFLTLDLVVRAPAPKELTFSRNTFATQRVIHCTDLEYTPSRLLHFHDLRLERLANACCN